jgi:rubrerythrin
MKTAVKEIENINEILTALSKAALHEVRDFASYLADKERRHKEFVEQTLKAEKEPDTVMCKSVEEAMQAIYNAPDDDEEA